MNNPMKKLLFCFICICGCWGLFSCDDYDIIESENDENMQVNPERQGATPPTIDADWQLELIPDVGRQADNLFVYKDQKYNRMFSRTQGWNGGIGGISTLLPDGSILWAFNDSYFGVVDAADRARVSGNMPQNALLIQRATNGKLGETSDDLISLADYVEWSDAASGKYLWGRTYMRHPNANKNDEQIANGEIDTGRAYCVGAATTVTGKLQIIWEGMTTLNGLIDGMTLTTHSLDGAIPTHRYNAQLNDYLPQSGDFLCQESKTEYLVKGGTFFGQALCNGNDGHLYLYAAKSNNIYVARTKTLDLGSQWEYYIRNAETGIMEWQETFPTNVELTRSSIIDNGYVAIQPTIFFDDGIYYMVAQGGTNSTEVYVYTAASPVGPFTNQKLLFNLPSFIDKVGITTYSTISQVNTHPALSRNGELVISACTKANATADNFTYAGSADFTRPYFFRIFNWKEVYK